MRINNVRSLRSLFILIFGNMLLMLLLSILSRNFFTYGNLSSVMLRMSVYAMLGIATTIVFISGGFDLTIGAVMSLSGALAGTLYAVGIPFYVVVVVSLFAGGIVGIINGYFIVNLRLSPFIVTLATMSIVQSIVYGILKGNVITTLPESFLNLGYVYLFKIPLLFVFMVVIAIISSIMVTRSVLGRRITAVGGNEKTAFISGINIGRIKYTVYILSGVISATAGLMFTVRIRAVIPDAGFNAPLEVITAVLIGGTTIYGGKGSILGSILGVLTMYLLLNGFSLLGLNPFWEVIIFGILLILIVGQDQVLKPVRGLLKLKDRYGEIMERIKYGMIGFGGIAENRIAKEGFGLDVTRFNGNPDAQLVGVLDINLDRKGAAEALNLKWYHDLEQLLNADIDAVYVATNNSSHFTIAKKVIEKGKHCLIEKPMTTNVSDARTLQKLARDKNISLNVDHMMKYNNYNIRAKELINTNTLGIVNDIVLHMEFSYGSSDEEASSWRCSIPEELGGPIGDVGSHCFYMAEFLLGDVVTEVSCVLTPQTYNLNVENGAVICFKTLEGREGSILVSFNKKRGGLLGTLSNLGFEVYGSEGVVRSYGTLFQLSGHNDEPVKQRIVVETLEGVKNIVPQKIENIYQQQISHHAQSIRSGDYLDGSDAFHNLQLLFACFKSVEENSRYIKV